MEAHPRHLVGAAGQRKRRRADTSQAVRCSECGDGFPDFESWYAHTRRVPCCADAEPVRIDLECEGAAAINLAASATSYASDIKQHCVKMYSELQFEKLLDRSCIQETIKENFVEPMLCKVKEEIYKRMAGDDEDAWRQLDQLIGTVFDVHADIQTSAKEEKALQDMVKPVCPVRRELVDRPDSNFKRTGPRTGDYCYDVPIDKELQSMFANDPTLISKLKAEADSWAKKKPARGSSKTVYADIADGQVLRDHPGLGTQANRSDGSVRLAFILYYDDLEVCNPLGAFHGRHKLGMFYWTLVNYDPAERFSFANIHLMTVALSSDIDYYGIQQIVSGMFSCHGRTRDARTPACRMHAPNSCTPAPALTGITGDSSFGSSMTKLDEGIVIGLPDKSTYLFRGWCVLLSADYPAAALCCGFKKSTSAAVFCRACYCNQNHPDYPSPTSFINENAHLSCDICRRDRQGMQADYVMWQTKKTAKEKEEFMASIGLNSFEHAFTRVPHFDVSCMVPYDFMHGELEGTIKNELAAMLYYFIRHRPGWNFTLTKVNAAIRGYSWPDGYAPPTFTAGYLETGTKKKQCKKGAHVHMTSGDVLTFARHSVGLLLPLVGDTSDPLWRCWVIHMQYFNILLQHEVTHADVVELDALIYQHHQLFLQDAKNEYGDPPPTVTCVM